MPETRSGKILAETQMDNNEPVPPEVIPFLEALTEWLADIVLTEKAGIATTSANRIGMRQQ